jgi:hypothetical protein
LDNIGGVYVTGSTTSKHFPGAPALTPNPTAGFVSKFSFNLTQLRYTKPLGAQVSGVAVLKPAGTSSVPEIYAAGYRYTGGTDSSNEDAFVVKLDDDVAQSQVLWHNPATDELSAWVLDSQGRVTATETLSKGCACCYWMFADLEGDQHPRFESRRHWRRALAQCDHRRTAGLAAGWF